MQCSHLSGGGFLHRTVGRLRKLICDIQYCTLNIEKKLVKVHSPHAVCNCSEIEIKIARRNRVDCLYDWILFLHFRLSSGNSVLCSRKQSKPLNS